MGDIIELGLQRRSETTLLDLVDDFLAAVDLSENTPRAYRASLEAFADDVGHRRLDSIGRATIERHLRERYAGRAPATVNRHLAAISAMFGWAAEIGILEASPAAGIRRRRQPRSARSERQGRPIPLDELQALFEHRDHLVRDRVLWRLLYDSAARAREVLNLNIEDIDFAKKRATVIGKGGGVETIQWSTDTARVFPAVLRWHHLRRESGPVFLSSRKLRGPSARDVCALTGRPRLSYNRASEIFKTASRGRTLHQLRHSRLPHLAESGVDATILRAISRHASLRTLDRYVNPSAETVAAVLDEHAS
ncbi:tyrosine-type recombinase/integrase [Candidatus Poriferisodalis sp.]|uniref:tyrosine-type recombinase/integrase n=1 Tax=Candidatus Poriferisodalis sp. TaxID=3101277 RepID=UPI003B52C357